MTKPLVWLPRELAEPARGLSDALEIAETPDDPASSRRLSEVEFVVVNPFSLGVDAHFAKMNKLQVVQTTSAGIDWILDRVPQGVALCSARGAYQTPVAEWVLSAILSDYKSIPQFRDVQLSGLWSRRPVKQLAGSTVLLLGYGSIAKGVEARLRPFGTEFIRIARHARTDVSTLEDLKGLLPLADVVVLLVPLTEETDGLVDRDFLSRMKNGALLVNAARGRVVDTDALIEALNADRITAVLDVTEPEPLPEHHRLFSTPNVMITPHIAGGFVAVERSVEELIVDQLGRFSRGEPLLNVVTEGY